MNKHEFEQFLHEQIPITKAMEFNVEEFTPSKVKISAKLEPNKNDKSTAFGGSINSLMTICGWAMVYINIKPVDPHAEIVIKECNIKYMAPINGDFTAECFLPDEESKITLFETYDKRKKARLNLKVTCYSQDILSAELQGQYVAYKPKCYINL
ncbi:MAG: YiiD C-terminal domain-containing protein [Clostridiaceae bacterium]